MKHCLWFKPDSCLDQEKEGQSISLATGALTHLSLMCQRDDDIYRLVKWGPPSPSGTPEVINVYLFKKRVCRFRFYLSEVRRFLCSLDSYFLHLSLNLSNRIISEAVFPVLLLFETYTEPGNWFHILHFLMYTHVVLAMCKIAVCHNSIRLYIAVKYKLNVL